MVKIAESVLKQDIDSGLTLAEISRKHGLNKVSLWKRFKRNGWNSAKKSLFNEQDMIRLKDEYLSGSSVQAIAILEGVSSKVIWQNLRKADVVMRKPGNVIQVDNLFFNNIVSEAQAYWLGALCADGCVSSGVQKTISFTVQADDVEWVAAFKKAIGSTVRITFSDNGYSGAAQFVVTSERMHDDLVRHGVVPRKSKILECPVVSDDLKMHFWRGVLDGDGSIVDSKSMFVDAVCTGSEKFADAACEYIGSLNITCIKQFSAGVWRVKLYGDSARKYVSHLYMDSKVYLRRKYVRAMELIGVPIVLKNSVERVSNDVARVFIDKYHYLGSLKPSTTYGLYVDDVLRGVAAFGSCSSPMVARTIFSVGSEGVRELHRFCLKDAEANMASKFLASCLKLYKLDFPDVIALVSYADRAQGHEGTIYKAIGAIQLKSSSDKQLVVVSPDGKRWTGRQDVILKSLANNNINLADCRIEESEGKLKFVMLLGSTEEKSILLKQLR